VVEDLSKSLAQFYGCPSHRLSGFIPQVENRLFIGRGGGREDCVKGL